MPMEVDRNGLEVIGREECLRLLIRAHIGRLALTSGALPMVVPVNFLLDSDQIILRTGAGTKLDRAITNAVVAFEVDEIDLVSHGGWSVVVTGIAREVTDTTELARLMDLPVPQWTPEGGDHFVAISLDLVDGRRIPYGAWRHDALAPAGAASDSATRPSARRPVTCVTSRGGRSSSPSSRCSSCLSSRGDTRRVREVRAAVP